MAQYTVFVHAVHTRIRKRIWFSFDKHIPFRSDYAPEFIRWCRLGVDKTRKRIKNAVTDVTVTVSGLCSRLI